MHLESPEICPVAKDRTQKYWIGSTCIGFEDERYHCKGQKRFEEPDPEPNKGLDPGSPEPVSRTLTALHKCNMVTEVVWDCRLLASSRKLQAERSSHQLGVAALCRTFDGSP